MSRGGTGSALIVLMFAVLCLTIFSVMAYVSAQLDKRLAEAELNQVKAFYAADTLAEQVLYEALLSDGRENILGLDIHYGWDGGKKIVSFTSPVNDTKNIHVTAAVNGGKYEIISWQMYDDSIWEADELLDVWPGF